MVNPNGVLTPSPTFQHGLRLHTAKIAPVKMGSSFVPMSPMNGSGPMGVGARKEPSSRNFASGKMALPVSASELQRMRVMAAGFHQTVLASSPVARTPAFALPTPPSLFEDFHATSPGRRSDEQRQPHDDAERPPRDADPMLHGHTLLRINLLPDPAEWIRAPKSMIPTDRILRVMNTRIAAAQVYADPTGTQRSVEKACDLFAEAARLGVQVLAFPETWLPGYPAWLDACRDTALWDHAPVKRAYARLHGEAIEVPGPDGQVMAGPVHDEETILHVDVDLARIPEEMMTLDVTGHYARPDVLRLERRGGALEG